MTSSSSERATGRATTPRARPPATSSGGGWGRREREFIWDGILLSPPHSGCRYQAYSRALMWRSKALSSSVLQAA